MPPPKQPEKPKRKAPKPPRQKPNPLTHHHYHDLTTWEAVIQEVAAGIPVSTIAQSHGVSRQQIYTKLKEPEWSERLDKERLRIRNLREKHIDDFVKRETSRWMKLASRATTILEQELDRAEEARKTGKHLAPNKITIEKPIKGDDGKTKVGKQVIETKDPINLESALKIYSTIMRPFFDAQRAKDM
jgi:hypothetical protein